MLCVCVCCYAVVNVVLLCCCAVVNVVLLCCCVVCVAQYQCPEDSQCVDYHKVCDQHPDCLDGLDEQNCTRGTRHTHTHPL